METNSALSLMKWRLATVTCSGITAIHSTAAQHACILSDKMSRNYHGQLILLHSAVLCI